MEVCEFVPWARGPGGEKKASVSQMVCGGIKKRQQKNRAEVSLSGGLGDSFFAGGAVWGGEKKKKKKNEWAFPGGGRVGGTMKKKKAGTHRELRLSAQNKPKTYPNWGGLKPGSLGGGGGPGAGPGFFRTNEKTKLVSRPPDRKGPN